MALMINELLLKYKLLDTVIATQVMCVFTL